MSTYLLVHRHDLKRSPLRLETEAFWLWHFMNAYEENEQIVIDFVYYPSSLGSANVSFFSLKILFTNELLPSSSTVSA